MGDVGRVGIVVGLPRGVVDLLEKVKTSYWGPFTVPAMLLLVLVMFLVVAFIVYGSHQLSRAQIDAEADRYRHLIEGLRDGKVATHA